MYLLGDTSKLFLKNYDVKSWTPSPLLCLVSWLIGLEDSGRYTCRTFCITSCVCVDTSSRPIIKKGLFEVYAKISIMALTPSPDVNF